MLCCVRCAVKMKFVFPPTLLNSRVHTTYPEQAIAERASALPALHPYRTALLTASRVFGCSSW